MLVHSDNWAGARVSFKMYDILGVNCLINTKAVDICRASNEAIKLKRIQREIFQKVTFLHFFSTLFYSVFHSLAVI